MQRSDDPQHQSVLEFSPTIASTSHNVSIDNHEVATEPITTFPDGGKQAMLVLFGCSCIAFAGLALLNCPGSLQAWISTNELPDESIARLGWIFGFYTFMSFFAGIQIGPFFDAYGPRVLIWLGSSLLLATYIVMGYCRTYWQFFLTLGLMGGIGTSLLLTSAIATVQLWYFRHRGLATAIALCGGSVSGMVFPLTLQKLLPKIGFAWTLRVIALLMLPFLIIGCTFTRKRLARRIRKPSLRGLVFEPRILLSPDIAFTTLGVYSLEWALFVVLSYLSSYALHQGMSFDLSYQLLAYVNAGSLVGRLTSGYIGDRIGRYNTQTVALFLCSLSILGVWLVAGSSPALLILFALFFGFGSGSSLSLTPVCVSQLCEVERFGRTYTAVYTVSSLGTLTGIPVAGEILATTDGDYWSVIVFSGAAYVLSLLCFATVRVQKVGWSLSKKF